MKYMSRICCPERSRDFGMTRECTIIKIRCGPSGCGVFIQVCQFHTQYGRLNSIQPAIASYYVMLILAALTMVRDHFHRAGQFIIIGEYGTSIAKSTQVFGGIKRSGTNMPD